MKTAAGGFKVYPKQVETEIDAKDGVMDSAVIGVPHPVSIGGEQSGNALGKMQKIVLREDCKDTFSQ